MPSVAVLADLEPMELPLMVQREALHLSEDLGVALILLHAGCFLRETLPGHYKA